MALDRIAAETPSAVRQHGQWLLEIASNDEFPHVLVRSFAKSAVCKLERGSPGACPGTTNALKRANTSPVRGRKAANRIASASTGTLREREDRRFHFDSVDTLPYWYTRALRVFADVSGEEFLDGAERWIVDRWGVQTIPGGGRRAAETPLLRPLVSVMASHGSLPILERFHTYLEWHAMWCATGELMQTRALAKAAEDDNDTFEHWLSQEGLTVPPLWLADLHGMKPLEDRLWFSPQDDVNTWVENVGDDDFLVERGPGSDDGMIVVVAPMKRDRGTSCSRLGSKRHSSHLTPPTALVRAFQTIDDSWDYRIPSDGNDLEIDAPPYKLVGWP